MKICLLNTYDQEGGAARACNRLYRGLLQHGVDVKFLVRERAGEDYSILTSGYRVAGKLGALLDERMLHRYPKRQLHNFSTAKRLAFGMSQANKLLPDIFHLHWVPKGFVRVEDIQKIPTPIIWTLHDSWPFTGGCHLPGNCIGYQAKCGTCPVLGSDVDNDLSRNNWKRKKQSYPLNRITLVAPSLWMADKARSSSLLGGCKVEVIPNALDSYLYSPGDKSEARAALGLPTGRKIILFGAKNVLSDPNKGAELVWRAVQGMPAEIRCQCSLVVFGQEPGSYSVSEGLDVINLGEVTDETQIVSLYRAADVLVMTSRQENLPNIIAEAMSCGLPCVAFGVGGIPEQICHRRNGCLVESFDVPTMSSELGWLLSSEGQQKILSVQARTDAERLYSFENVSMQHIALYEKVVYSV
jgi:glycosyltransferase involved in cell wall biosynthesis